MQETTKHPPASAGDVKLNVAKTPHKYTKVSVEEEANLLSKLFFGWTSTIINYGVKQAFTEEDLFEVRKDEKFSYAWNAFLKHYNDKTKKTYKSVPRAIFAVIGKAFWASFILLVAASLLQFAGPLLLKEILIYIAMPGIPEYKGYLYATGILLAFIVRAIITQHGTHSVISLSLKTLVSTQSSIFDKILKIKASARGYVDTGKIVNLATVDCLGIFRFCTMISYLTTAPFVIIVALALIINEVGASGLMGLAVIFVGTILNGIVSGKVIQIRFGGMIYNDQRSKAITEYISGIRVIKYYGWERFALKKVEGIRKHETDLLYRLAVWRGILDFLTNLVPLCISVAVFGVYVASGNNLTPAKAFTTLSLFNLIQLPVRMLGFSLFFYANTQVSLKRIQHFSEWENHEPVNEEKALQAGTIEINNGNFSWDTKDAKVHSEVMKTLFAPRGRGPPGKKGPQGKPSGKPTADKGPQGDNTPKASELEKKPSEGDSPVALRQQSSVISRTETETNPLIKANSEQAKKIETILYDINLKVSPGEFLGVIGQVGSGKSSLVNAMIGEMNKNTGDIKYNGSIAYVPQQAWLRNATLKENILFGNPYDEQFYQHVLKVCELSDDIAMLPGGDQTEIGERGINLSGGQKQRISIARAVYAKADIYIIDDCLSALDAHVGRQIYENVLRGELVKKTVVFVTHALHYVAEAHRVAVMKQGRIVELDTPSVLQSNPSSEYNRLTINAKPTEPESPVKAEKEGKIKEKKAEKGPAEKKAAGDQDEMKKKGTLGTQEERATGAVPFRVYKGYITSGGSLFTVLTVILFLLAQGCRQVTDWWLSIWSNGSYGLSSGTYILWYFIISFITALAVLLRGFIFGLFTRETSINLFSRLLLAIFRSPMSWFDTTPSGRILNRTSKDQDDVDSNLPFTIQMSVQNLLQLFGTIIFIGVITPLFFAFAAVLVVYYIYAIHVYLKSSRELKRVERVALGPALSLFSECSNGYQVIRAFKKEKFFVNMFQERFDKYLKAASGGASLERWVSLRTDLFASLIVGAASYFGVLAKTFNTTDDSGLIGLSISWSLSITGLISFAIKTLSDTELQMNSVERILQYIDKPEKEADWDNPKAPQGWPTAGKFEAENVTYRYRDGLPDVINAISFSIESNERIGVVGRTGSGKSTLTLGLLRILEIAERNGKKGTINLDGTVIGNIGLHELRKKITIIPQDPVLFTGTVRSNVDPFNEYADKDIIDALKKVQIWDQIKMDQHEQTQQKMPGARPMKKLNPQQQKQQREKELELANLSEDEKKLRMIINDGGSNFSLGQRQLICMARALVRKPKVLLMDEATASIDELTDYLIQKMIKTEFVGTTVITIAHRLNTIIQYDRILVMDQGNIAEFDTPINLLDQETSYFAKLVKENGPDFEGKMRYLAKNKAVNLDELNLPEVLPIEKDIHQKMD